MECDWAIIEKFVMKSAECKVWECDLRVKNLGPVTISIDKLTSYCQIWCPSAPHAAA